MINGSSFVAVYPVPGLTTLIAVIVPAALTTEVNAAPTPAPAPTLTIIVFVVAFVIARFFPDAGSVDLGYDFSFSYPSLEHVKNKELSTICIVLLVVKPCL